MSITFDHSKTIITQSQCNNVYVTIIGTHSIDACASVVTTAFSPAADADSVPAAGSSAMSSVIADPRWYSICASWKRTISTPSESAALDHLTVAKDSMMRKSSISGVWWPWPYLPFAYTTELVVVEFWGCWNRSGINAGIIFNYYSDLHNCEFA